MTRYEKLISGTKEDLINEIVLVAKWARELTNMEWKCITQGWGGLEGFVRETLDIKLIDNNNKTEKVSTGNKYTCCYAHRTYDDRDGAEYWCTLYNKDCDSCK